MCMLSAPCSSKQSQVQHVNFIMYTFKVYQVNSAVHMGSIQENVHYQITI